MASIVIQSSEYPSGTLNGTQFCGSPVVVQVNMTSSFTTGSTARKIQLYVVKCNGLSEESSASVKEKVSDTAKCVPIEWQYYDSTEHYEDISSALRSLMGTNKYNPNEISGSCSLDIIRYALVVGHSELSGGVVKSYIDGVVTDGMFAIRGSLTDLERYALGNNAVMNDASTLQLNLTSKPSEIEVLSADSVLSHAWLPLYSMNVGQSGSQQKVQPAPQVKFMKASELKDSRDDYFMSRSYYIDSDASSYRHFCFINSKGAIETVSARCLDAKQVSIDKKTYMRDNTPSRVPRMYGNTYSVMTEQPYEQYSMSSGNTTRAWVEWWTKEFLTAQFHWMQMVVGGKDVWVPVHVTPSKKDVTLYDKSKAQALSVDFAVKLAFTN